LLGIGFLAVSGGRADTTIVSIIISKIVTCGSLGKVAQQHADLNAEKRKKTAAGVASYKYCCAGNVLLDSQD
jgi:hypothetical protein